MNIHIASRRKKHATLEREFPNAALLDVTSKAAEAWVAFSPFYPHGDIPVPFSPDYTAQSVEGIWQGLKVFESADVDLSKFDNATMKNLKRTVRKFGAVKGHRKGVAGTTLLGYREARYAIYLPSYRWVLDKHLHDAVEKLRAIASRQPLVLLDYEINTDVENVAKPLSHAGLIRAYLLDDWPTR